MNNLVWVAGVRTINEPGTNLSWWNLMGVFTSKELALKMCTQKEHFVGAVQLDVGSGPDEITPLIDCEYPFLVRGEDGVWREKSDDR